MSKGNIKSYKHIYDDVVFIDQEADDKIQFVSFVLISLRIRSMKK